MLRITVLAICLALTYGASVKKQATKQQKDPEWEKPVFCQGNDCPVYEVVAEFEGYELRNYPSATWVSTTFEASSSEEADEKSGLAFNKLFNYIDGQNDRDEIINMTAPVLTYAMPGIGSNNSTVYERSFYLPYALQDSAPIPTAEDVYLMQLEELDVCVSWFTDYADTVDYERNAIELAETVGLDNIETTSFFSAGYDSPFKWWDRRNESWLKVKAVKN